MWNSECFATSEVCTAAYRFRPAPPTLCKVWINVVEIHWFALYLMMSFLFAAAIYSLLLWCCCISRFQVFALLWIIWTNCNKVVTVSQLNVIYCKCWVYKLMAYFQFLYHIDGYKFDWWYSWPEMHGHWHVVKLTQPSCLVNHLWEKSNVDLSFQILLWYPSI
jgi:hypothetical protein